MMNYSKETFRLKFRNDIYLPLTRRIRRRNLKNTDFTIISNNCWGGTVYESYGIRKMSPTVGMFIMPKDYLKLILNLKYYLDMPLVFIDPDESKWKTVLSYKGNWGKYLIGKLDDIELQMLHYHDERIALEKWKNRVKRVNYEKILYKFNDQNGATQQDITTFMNMPMKNKLCFVAQEKMKVNDRVILIKQPESLLEGIKASREPFGNSKYINITNIINAL